ncbi:hypothetical protein Vretimale_16754, partial [Volvox reticuliferus]
LNMGRIGDRGFGQLRRKAAAAARAAGQKQKRKLSQQQQQPPGKTAQERRSQGQEGRAVPAAAVTLRRAGVSRPVSHGLIGDRGTESRRRDGGSGGSGGNGRRGGSVGPSSQNPDLDQNPEDSQQEVEQCPQQTHTRRQRGGSAVMAAVAKEEAQDTQQEDDGDDATDAEAVKGRGKGDRPVKRRRRRQEEEETLESAEPTGGSDGEVAAGVAGEGDGDHDMESQSPPPSPSQLRQPQDQQTQLVVEEGPSGPGAGGRQGQGEGVDAASQLHPDGDLRRSLPRALWAAEPEMVVGNGLEESEREHVTALRKCLALYIRVAWERSDLATLQAAVPVLYGATEKMPYVRDLAALALGLAATGAVVAACDVVGVSLTDVAGRMGGTTEAGRNGGGGAASPGSETAAGEAWLQRLLEERVQRLFKTALGEAAAAAEAAVAAEAAAAEAAGGEAAAAAGGNMAIDNAGAGGAGGQGAEDMEKCRDAMQLDGPGAAPTLIPAPPGDLGDADQMQQSQPQPQPQAGAREAGGPATRTSRGGPSSAIVGVGSSGGSGTHGGAGASAAASGAAAPVATSRSALASSPSWMALLDALAPLCALNFDYWMDSAGAGGAGSQAPARPSLVTAAVRAETATRQYGRQVP